MPLNLRFFEFSVKHSRFFSTAKPSKTDISSLPVYKNALKLTKIHWKIQKKLQILNKRLTFPYESSSLNLIPFRNHRRILEDSFIQLLKDSNATNFPFIIKILSKNQFKSDLITIELNQKKALGLLEGLFDLTMNENPKLTKRNALKLLIKTQGIRFFPKNHPFLMKILRIHKQSPFENLMKKLSFSQRIDFFSQIIKYQYNSQIKSFIFLSPIFLSDSQQIIASFSKKKLIKLLKILTKSKQKFDFASQILEKFNELTIKDLKSFKKPQLIPIILFIENFQRDSLKKQDFYFKLRLLRIEKTPLFTPKQLRFFQRKFQQKSFTQIPFLNEEIEFSVKNLLDKKVYSWDLNDIVNLSKLLNSEYYVFSYYKVFVKIIRELYFNKEFHFISIKSLLQRLSVIKELKLRFPKEFFDKILDNEPFIRDFILLKTSRFMIELLLGSDAIKTPFIFETYEAIQRIKANYAENLMLSSEITSAQISLMNTALFFNKRTFNDENEILQKTLKDLSLNVFKIDFLLKKKMRFFLYNAIPILQSKSINVNLLKICEELQRKSAFGAFFSPNRVHKDFFASGPEKEIFEIMKKMGVLAKCNSFIGVYNVDFFIETRKLIVEYHGLQHFFLENVEVKEMMPRDLLKKEVFKLLGYKYLIVKGWIWKKLRSREDKQLFVKNLLKSEKEFNYEKGTKRRVPNSDYINRK